jgi:hypothetical protein
VERLRAQWYLGWALTATAGALFGASVVLGFSSRPGSMRNGWWLILSFLGMGLVLVHLSLLGSGP